jgi:outer membrane lipoprotein-sorting protein
MKKVGKNDQRGIAHLMLIVIIVVVVGGIGLVGWRVMSAQKDKDSGTKSSTASSVVSDSAALAACLKEVNDKNLCKFASGYKLDGVAYHAKFTTTGSDGTSTSEMDTDSKTNTSMTTTQGGKELMASISLNGTTYIKDETSGTWLKYPPADNSAPKTDNPTSDVKVDTNDITEKNTITYKSLGKEACGNLTCYKYQVVDTTQPKSEQFIWFDTKEYRLQRWTNKDDQGTTDMTITYKSVNIKAPSPVKDFSAQSSADLQAAQAAAAAAAASVNSGDDE